MLEPTQGIYRAAAAVVPMRQTANHRAEQVSQMLFGESCVCITDAGEWLYVRTHFDDYEGWVTANQLQAIPHVPASYYRLTKQLVAKRTTDSKTLLRLPMGACISPDTPIILPKSYHHYSKHPSRKAVLQCALRYMGAPYLWGGRSAWGIDCSGLVQMAFALVGMAIPRDSKPQAEAASRIRTKPQPADIAFFGAIGSDTISHVGLILPNDKILHAFGSVRIDSLTAKGIMNTETQNLTHVLLEIKTLFAPHAL